MAEPTPTDLKTRYPAFAAVDDAAIQYWLTDAARFVDTSWMEGDYGPAKLAYAAHNLAANDSTALPQGVTQFKSGVVNISLSDAQASATGFETTRYGMEYLALLRRNFTGPRIYPSKHVL